MEIDSLVQDYSTYIYNYAMKLTCHPQKAEDIAQETLIQAWKNLSQLKEEKAVKKWLRSICMNCFLMDYRKNNPKIVDYIDDMELLECEGNLISPLPEPEEEVVVEEAIRNLQNGCFYAMVRRLTLKQRMVFSLIDMFGLQLAEVAQLLELSQIATKGLLYRARMNLDAFFHDHCYLINEKNPCSCKAWIEFSKTRSDNQQNTRKLIDSLEGRSANYIFDPRVRAKIYYLYKNMPESKPSKEWYQNLILSLR